MKKHETRYTAPEKLHSLTLEQLISAWESTENPMCLSCVCFCSDCNGTQEQSYTGCIYKKIVI